MVTRQELAQRVGRLQELMDRLDLDACLLFGRSTVRYFTGVRTNTATFSILFLHRSGHLAYVVPVLDYQVVKRECWLAEEGAILPFPEDTPNYLEVLRQFLGDADRATRIGLDRQATTVAQLDMLKGLCPRLEVVGLDAQLLRLRAVKSPAEVGLIRQAAWLADMAMQEAWELVRPGITEGEIVRRALSVMLAQGAEGPSFEPFAMSGPNSWLPRRYATSRAIGPGELIIFDLGVRFQGYCADLTRTFWAGSLPGPARELFELAEAAQKAALEAVKPGVVAGQVDEAARRLIREAGYGEFFPHLTGHGVGLDIHEEPIVDRGAEGPLEPGMVLTVEPGVYVPGVGGARIEDMVLVTETGWELLTHTPRVLATGR